MSIYIRNRETDETWGPFGDPAAARRWAQTRRFKLYNVLTVGANGAIAAKAKTPTAAKAEEAPSQLEFQLDSYLIQPTVCTCTHCNATTTSDAVFEQWVQRSMFAGVTPIRRSVPAAKLQAGYPIRLTLARQRSIPVCSACLPTLPQATPVQSISEDEWRDTLRRKYTTAPDAPKIAVRTAPTKHVTAISSEDL